MTKTKRKKVLARSQNFGEFVSTTMSMPMSEVAVLPDQRSLYRLIVLVGALVVASYVGLSLSRSANLVSSVTTAGSITIPGTQSSDAALQTTESSAAFQSTRSDFQVGDPGISAQDTQPIPNFQGTVGTDPVSR